MVSFSLMLFVALVFLIICRAAQAGTKAGIAARVYRNTGTYGSPTWTATNCVRDAQPAFPWDLVDASKRATRAKLYGKTQIDLSVQLVCKADDADTGYGALVDLAVSPTAVLDMLVLDGPLTAEGARGVRAHWLGSLSSQPQGAGDNVYTTIDLKPADSSEGVPSAITVGAASAITAVAW